MKFEFQSEPHIFPTCISFRDRIAVIVLGARLGDVYQYKASPVQRVEGQSFAIRGGGGE